MTKEELEIDNKRLDFNEKVQLIVKKEELKEQDIRLNKLCFDYYEKEKRIAELEKENAELKEVHESDKMSLRLIAEKGANLKKVSDKYKEMVEDMKCDMCGTSDTTLCNYLIAILKKYGEIV